MRQTGMRLSAEEIQKTIDRLDQRIHDRFPESGLSGVCRELSAVSRETDEILEWIGQPHRLMRGVIGLFLGLVVLAAGYSVAHLDVRTDGINLAEFVQMIEAGVNEVVLLAAGITFLVTFETRRRRRRVVQAVNRLRTIAHLIDAHQLTKDPDMVSAVSTPTAHSPSRGMNDFELGRYLDYCSELLSLVGKLGFLYVQDFNDPAANSAVNDLEDLSTGLSQKIWQKIIILRRPRTR